MIPAMIRCIRARCPAGLVVFGLVIMSFTGWDPRSAAGSDFTLRDGNSRVKVDPAIQTTVHEWNVEGTQHLKELSNWYRIGSSRESPLNTLALFPAAYFDSNGNGVPDSVQLVYGSFEHEFVIEAEYRVVGGAPGSGLSSLFETVRIRNLGSADLDFHFFEYIDFDLSHSPTDDTAGPITPAAGEQSDPLTIVSGGSTDVDHYEYGFAPNIRAAYRWRGVDIGRHASARRISRPGQRDVCAAVGFRRQRGPAPRHRSRSDGGNHQDVDIADESGRSGTMRCRPGSRGCDRVAPTQQAAAQIGCLPFARFQPLRQVQF